MLVCAVALIAQATVVHYLAVRGVVPSLVLVVVVWYAIRVDVRRAALFGLFAGICEDVLAGTTGAAWTISTTLTAVFTSLLTRDFFADSIPLAAAVTAIATVMRALLFWTVMSLEGYPSGLAGVHLHQALWQAAFNVVVMIAAVLILRRVEVETA
ncbi:MAG: rod shape-determining protein MreD [Candidatus Eremiobacteraeota bacterium]|nr:rod shape-determining protein MreD [Candidatus Eremiobacteraeota bacterium]